ncbi:MAG: hypothetical protein ABI718_05460 [Acidobacteriota bacterium]
MKSLIAVMSLMLSATVLQAGSDSLSAVRQITGEAQVTSAVKHIRSQRGREDGFSLPITIDLTRVFVNGHNPVLGAYVARIEFDAQAVEYVQAEGGTSSYFATAPFATNSPKANADGVVRLCYVQNDATAPSGIINVARVIFRELKPGGAASVKVTIESLAAGLERDADGNFIRDLQIDVDGARK